VREVVLDFRLLPLWRSIVAIFVSAAILSSGCCVAALWRWRDALVDRLLDTDEPPVDRQPKIRSVNVVCFAAR